MLLPDGLYRRIPLFWTLLGVLFLFLGPLEPLEKLRGGAVSELHRLGQGRAGLGTDRAAGQSHLGVAHQALDRATEDAFLTGVETGSVIDITANDQGDVAGLTFAEVGIQKVIANLRSLGKDFFTIGISDLPPLTPLVGAEDSFAFEMQTQ